MRHRGFCELRYIINPVVGYELSVRIDIAGLSRREERRTTLRHLLLQRVSRSIDAVRATVLSDGQPVGVVHRLVPPVQLGVVGHSEVHSVMILGVD